MVYRCWWQPAHVSWAHFLLGLDKPNFSLVPTPQWAKRGQQYPQLALGPVPELWLQGSLSGCQNSFSYLAIPLVLYTRFLDKTNFPRILTPRARYLQDPSTILTRFGPWTVPGAPVAYRCWEHQAHVSLPHFPLWLDKTNFPRVPTTLGAKDQQCPQLQLGPVPELWLRVGYPGVRSTFSYPQVLYPRFLDKTNFPQIETPRDRYS